MNHHIKHRRLSLEPLESRQLLALTVTIDYSYDSNNFFDTTAKRDLLQLAADALASNFDDDLDAIASGGGNTWTASFFNPADGSIANQSNLSVAADELIIYAGGRDLGSTLGQGGPGGYSASGSSAWLTTLNTRGESGAGLSSPTDFGPWGGAITFNTTSNWHFGETTSGLENSEFDFYSVALHELVHFFGVGTSNSWDELVVSDGNGGLEFVGINSVFEYDGSGNVPLSASAGHWASGTTDDGQETALDPSIAAGTRKELTRLDWAGLDDLGWGVDLTEDIETKVIASDFAASDWFGMAVDIDGDWAVVGAPREDTAADDAGAVYLYKYETGSWVEKAKITPTNGGIKDRFGESVAINGDTIVVGAWLTDSVGTNAGAAYVYQRDNGGTGNWGEVAQLIGSVTTSGDHFGVSVDIDGDTIVIGSHYDDAVDTRAGAAFIYDRDYGGTDTWGEVKQITGSDTTIKDSFGQAVAIDGDRVVVGAMRADISSTSDVGAAYIFERDNGGAANWGEVAKIIAADGDASDQFGFDVAIDGTTVVVGSRLDDDVFRSSGSAYIFEKDQGGTDNWGQIAKVTSSSPTVGAWFGTALSIDGDTLLVGSKYEKSDGDSQVGAAYVFGRDAGGPDAWGETQRIVASDAANKDRFAFDVAMSGYRGLIGAQLEDPSATNAGSAYVILLDGALLASLAPPPPSANLAEPAPTIPAAATRLSTISPTDDVFDQPLIAHAPQLTGSEGIFTFNKLPGGCACGGMGCAACVPPTDLALVDNVASMLSLETAEQLNMANDRVPTADGSSHIVSRNYGIYPASRPVPRRFVQQARRHEARRVRQFEEAVDSMFTDMADDGIDDQVTR